MKTMCKVAMLVTATVTGALLFAEEPKAGTSTPSVAKEKFLAITGGFVEKELPPGAKVVRIVDATTGAGATVATQFQNYLHKSLRLPSKVEKGEIGKIDNKDGDVVLAIVDAGDFVVYPEKSLAVVPVGTIGTEQALEKGLALILAVNSKEMTTRSIMQGAAAKGIPTIVRTSYKRAVELGWAPAPTNDYQRAIFEAVKTNKADMVSSPAATSPAK